MLCNLIPGLIIISSSIIIFYILYHCWVLMNNKCMVFLKCHVKYDDCKPITEIYFFLNIKDNQVKIWNLKISRVLLTYPARKIAEIRPIFLQVLFSKSNWRWFFNMKTISLSVFRAGTVWVNCYDVLEAQAPFGGYKVKYSEDIRLNIRRI